MARMRLQLKVHKWSPHSYLPLTLTESDVVLEKNSKYSRQNKNIEGILKIWNDANTNLVALAQQMTNLFKEMNGKDDVKFTCWVLLIK